MRLLNCLFVPSLTSGRLKVTLASSLKSQGREHGDGGYGLTNHGVIIYVQKLWMRTEQYQNETEYQDDCRTHLLRCAGCRSEHRTNSGAARCESLGAYDIRVTPPFVKNCALSTRGWKEHRAAASVARCSCSFECPRPVPVENPTVATHLYRIAQEAIGKAIKTCSSEIDCPESETVGWGTNVDGQRQWPRL